MSTRQEGVEATEEAAGGKARAPVGHAPWESAEEKEQDLADMERILEEYKSGSDVEEAAEVAAAVCSLCDGREGEVTGNCKAGNCETCCQSSRGTGVWQCCDGGFGSSGDESSGEAPEAAGGCLLFENENEF